jgi:hypothetical protein
MNTCALHRKFGQQLRSGPRVLQSFQLATRDSQLSTIQYFAGKSFFDNILRGKAAPPILQLACNQYFAESVRKISFGMDRAIIAHKSLVWNNLPVNYLF